MKRSEINAIIKSAEEFSISRKFYLPPFGYWSLDDWKTCKNDISLIHQQRLGWDITDFGMGDFEKYGLTLFTIRNGDKNSESIGASKDYAEKLLIVEVGQTTPLHFHWSKAEDIINRGGGNLIIQLYNSTKDEGLSTKDVEVWIDSIRYKIPAGGTVTLTPGESIMLPSFLYHAFWGEKEKVLVGEVSSVNDDDKDNRFYQAGGRFPKIEEDEPPYRLLVNDYDTFLGS